MASFEFDDNLQIDCQIVAGEWGDLAVVESKGKTALNAAVSVLDFPLPEGAEVSIVFSNDANVRELNAHWREQDKPTNVLSFATNDGSDRNEWSPLLGDIILARETLEREAKEQSKSFDHHLSHLIVHGFFHLLGFDHLNDKEANMMEGLEVKALAQLGIADPYAAQ